MSPKNRKSRRFGLCKLPWAPAMHPAAKDGWPPSRKLFGSLCCVLCLLRRAHPGLGYCPYKTAQGGLEPNVLNVPGRKMLTMNLSSRTVQYNYDNTPCSSLGRAGWEQGLSRQVPLLAEAPSGAILLGPGLPGRPLCNRIWEMGAHTAVVSLWISWMLPMRRGCTNPLVCISTEEETEGHNGETQGLAFFFLIKIHSTCFSIHTLQKETRRDCISFTTSVYDLPGTVLGIFPMPDWICNTVL